MRTNEEENKDFSFLVDEDKGVGGKYSELRNVLFHVSQVGLKVFWIPCSCEAAPGKARTLQSVNTGRVTENK